MPDRRIISLLASLALISWLASTSRAELSQREIRMGSSIQASVRSSEQDYFEGKFDSSGKNLREAMIKLTTALEGKNPEFYDKLVPLITRLDKTHAMLELEGISLPPFRRPLRPNLMSLRSVMPDGATPDSGTPGSPSTPTPDGSMVSFTKEVAPILAAKCGRCHVGQTRGNFSLASYAALMKGPPEGVVVFAGDVIGSRLIETIETGDMPRGGGRVSPVELKKLKDWILQGAKYDGDDPNAPLAGNATPAATPRPQAPSIMKATGRETVSFSADVAPLLVDNCTGCHIDAMQNQGGLRMDTFAQMMRGGDSGPMIVPGRGEASLLVKKLRGTATDGQRMPAGGRPALSEDAIKLVSKWIDEGATIDADQDLPVKVIRKLAWAANATSEELSARRAEAATRNLALTGSSAATSQTDTDHFHVVGTSSEATLELVGRLAEQQLKSAKTIVRGSGPAEDYFRGRATIFVLPKRYDYSEFAKMVEQRNVPGNWYSHWRFDGVDAYIAIVATEQDEEETLEDRLLAPLVSLAVATRNVGVPRWFSEGIGSATAMKQNAKSRRENEQLRQAAVEAATSVKDAKAFLGNRLTPEQSDAFGAALAMSMLDQKRRRALEICLRLLGTGKTFDESFTSSFGLPPAGYIDAYLQFVRR